VIGLQVRLMLTVTLTDAPQHNNAPGLNIGLDY